jgi:NAD(P)-dependent dehydrogenase (short-subunit alcohol dehydrogenase family)
VNVPDVSSGQVRTVAPASCRGHRLPQSRSPRRQPPWPWRAPPAGRFAVPGNAYYAASKHAVAAFSESLRLELAAFGIHVALVEPTAARTSLNTNTTWAGSSTGGPYNDFRRSLAEWHAQTYAGPPHNVAGRLAVSADDVAAVIRRAATSPHPRARYPVGTLARGLFLLRRWLPGPAFDAFLRTQFPAP